MRGGVFIILRRALRLHRLHKGGILIEFTFSIPVCITLLFFVSDHYRFYEMQNKAKTSAYLAASMLQQIANSRSEKALTKDDFARITFASCLNFFHTNSMFNPWPFGLYYSVSYEWVKRVNSNSYQFQHNYAYTKDEGNTSPMTMGKSCSAIKTISQAEVEAKNSDLVCDNDGEERVCIESCYRRKYDNSFDKNQLGFFILTPKTHKGIDDTTNCLFTYQVVISPKPGLFPGKSS